MKLHFLKRNFIEGWVFPPSLQKFPLPPPKEPELHSDRSLEITSKCLLYDVYTHDSLFKKKNNKKHANSGFLTTFQIFPAWDLLAP